MSEISNVRVIERPVAPPTAEASPPAQDAKRAAEGPGKDALEPAVTVDLRPGDEAPRETKRESDYQAKFVRDSDSRRIVFQVVDPVSGIVVEQLPSIQALKARAYGAAQALSTDVQQAAAEAQRPLDRIA